MFSRCYYAMRCKIKIYIQRIKKNPFLEKNHKKPRSTYLGKNHAENPDEKILEKKYYMYSK